MTIFLDNLAFSLEVVMPIFLIVVLGIWFRQRNIIDERFVTASSRVVFSLALPCLVFMNVSQMHPEELPDMAQIGYIYGGIIGFFLLCELAAWCFIRDHDNRGVFVQGSFRSNFAIVGLAVAANMMGEAGLIKAAVVLVFIVPIYNILSVIALVLPQQREKHLNWLQLLGEVANNPLILAVFAALPFVYFRITVPAVLAKTGTYLSALSLPLALLGIGGSLNFRAVRQTSAIAFSAVAIKLVLIPAVMIYGAWLLGYGGTDLVVMFVLFASPTAVASFMMVEAMGGNSRLAANIVLLSTLGSVVTISAGIVVLKMMGIF